jgi:hypothetical protein
MTTESIFLQLSTALTGVAGLPADLAEAYEARLRAEGLAAPLDRLQDAYRRLRDLGQIDADSLAQHLFADAELQEAAWQLIVLWYSSAMMEVDAGGQVGLKFGKPEHHFRALLWDAIGAHPPALSGGYFGYWHYPPEN